MNARFSFHYGNEQYSYCSDKSTAYELGDGVGVEVVHRAYPEYDAVEWVLYFENKGEKNSRIFSNILDSDTLLPLDNAPIPRSGYHPTDGNVCVIAMNGMVDGGYYWENDRISATEYALHHEYLDKASNQTKRFANVNGRSSDGTMPFFDVTTRGKGYIAAIGWTGDWSAEFARADEGVKMKTGLKETRFYLKPGERIRTSSILIMRYTDENEKYNRFRRLIKAHFSHVSHTKATREGLMAFELWGGLPSEEMKKRLRELGEHDIRFEDIWIDAGWYGECTKCDEPFSGDWSEHTGDWEVNTRVHPGELRDVAECAAESIGARLMLWIEPERAVKDTKAIQNHPEWFLCRSGDSSRILNYGNEEARRYAADLLAHYIEDLNLSCYRQDFNAPLTQFFKENDEENRRGMTEIKHIMGMYEIWDELHEKFPDLLIDNCSSGGRRFDIETLKRSIAFFRSDYQCNFNATPEVIQAHNSGISLYLPYNGCTSKVKDDTYAIRSSYSASWGAAFYNAIFQSMDEKDFAWAKKITEEYRSIRKYMTMDFYNHGSVAFDDTSWAVWQYHDEKTQSGVVMAFRRSASPFEEMKITLKGLSENATYRLQNLDDGTEGETDGSFVISLAQKRSSVIFKYEKISSLS